MTSPFISIDKAIEILQKGEMIILMDDEHRENEGDLVIAAEFATSSAINFMAKHGRGLICLPMAQEMIEKLNLPMMTNSNHSPFGTAFTVSIEASKSVSTGISASDRATTIQVAIKDDAKPSDIISPGHIFPLKANPMGVLKRTGQTEGSVDLMKLAGLKPASVICEIMNDDGTMSRLDDLKTFSKQHKIPLVSIRDIIEYRLKHESLITEVASSNLPLEEYGNFEMKVYQNPIENAEHFALIKPMKDKNAIPLVRIHSECITGDIFRSRKCDCGSQLDLSLKEISKQGGILIYLRQEGRGIGLIPKIKAYALQEKGLDTVEANEALGFAVDNREYWMAYQILKQLNISTIDLMTNNPLKVTELQKYGITIHSRKALVIDAHEDNQQYLKTKKIKLGHLL